MRSRFRSINSRWRVRLKKLNPLIFQYSRWRWFRWFWLRSRLNLVVWYWFRRVPAKLVVTFRFRRRQPRGWVTIGDDVMIVWWVSFLVVEVMTHVLLFRLNLHACPKACFRWLFRLGSWAGGHVLVCFGPLFWVYRGWILLFGFFGLLSVLIYYRSKKKKTKLFTISHQFNHYLHGTIFKEKTKHSPQSFLLFFLNKFS